jgi:quinol monooxygenase YgiN
MQKSEQLIIIAESHAKPGCADALREKLLTMIEPSRAEPGCVQYTLHEDPAEPGHFYFYEVWKDAAAFEFHTQTPHFKAFGPKVAEIRASGSLQKLKVLA